MTDKNGYNYNEFLSDSSDDYPQYADGLSEEQLDAVKEASFPIKQIDDDMNYAEAYDQPFHAKPPSNLIALENVLILAEERVEQFQSPDYNDQDIMFADDSILAVKAILNLMRAGATLKTIVDSNIELAKDDNLHEG